MADLLDRIRQEFDARMRDLRPVVREFERLQRAAAALVRSGARSVPGIRSDARVPQEGDQAGRTAPRAKPAAAGAKSAARKPPRPRAAAPGRKRAPRGQTQAKVLAALAAAPGSRAAAVAKASGTSTSVAGATISRLVKQGRVRRLDDGGYAVVEPTGSEAQSPKQPPPPSAA